MPSTYVVKAGETPAELPKRTDTSPGGISTFIPIIGRFGRNGSIPTSSFPEITIILPGASLSAPPPGPPGWTFNPGNVDPGKVNLFLTQDDLFQIDQIIKAGGRGATRRRGVSFGPVRSGGIIHGLRFN